MSNSTNGRNIQALLELSSALQKPQSNRSLHFQSETVLDERKLKSALMDPCLEWY
eukprot:m.846396 g.846396  ORF g.846396 m.846396 type:complete len:55 (+) comp23477_c1_seq96:4980-5144(+)